jgi:hypothetical protein
MFPMVLLPGNGSRGRLLPFMRGERQKPLADLIEKRIFAATGFETGLNKLVQ